MSTTPAGPSVPLLAARAIRKAFGPVEVLHGVDFDVRPGEVHVLAGENGAGKSTLIKILSGVHADFAGELQVGGRPRRFARPDEAARAGVATIHQELSLVPSMTVADNLFLGREATRRFGRVDFARQHAEAARILAGAGIDGSPRQLAGDLPISAQQMLEIARALAREASVVILDEPTSALGEREAEPLFERIRALRAAGRGIVYITHRMEEIYRLADRITVLRDGRLVGTAAPGALPPDKLVQWMVGDDVRSAGLQASPRGRAEAADGRAKAADGRAKAPDGRAKAADGRAKARLYVQTDEAPALEVAGLRVAHPAVPGRLVVDDVSFTAARGEILGLAGLQGAGTSETLHAIFGALGRRASFRARLDGEPLAGHGPREAIARGLVLLTNDRKALGLASDLSVIDSVSLASLARFSGPGGWMRRGEERAAVAALTAAFRLRAPSLDAPVGALSGGNQQKTYLARCLLARPRVLLLDEPTRGIDVGAKADIYGLMRAWVAEGIAIVLITSELDELLALADRVLVMHRGRVAAELARGEASKDAVLAAAMGHAARPAGGRP